MFLCRLKESKYSTLILASIFAFTLFLQCCFFHYQAFHSILISSLWNDPVAFFTFYTPKISISLFIASFIFLFKRKSWTIYVSFIVSIWCIAELVYYRMYQSFIDPYSILIVNNMNGFWDSIFPLIYRLDYILLALNISYMIFYLLLYNHSKNIKSFFCMILISICFQVIAGECLYIRNERYINKKEQLYNRKKSYIPFSDSYCEIIFGKWNTEYHIYYVKDTSVIHHFILDIYDLIRFINNNVSINIPIPRNINNFVNNKATISNNHNSRLIIILVESLENWVISENSTPNLNKFINANQNLLYAKRITKQTRRGNSADGQMIVNTGLLPTHDKTVCFNYFLNTFPSLSKLYKKSAALIPGHIGMWNQEAMSMAYGIDSSLTFAEDDILIFENTIKLYPKYDYLLSITISTHIPFNGHEDNANVHCDNLPNLMCNYIKCCNYFDANIGNFFNKLETDSILQNSTIVITGDHTIFPSEIRKEFSDYCKANNLDYKVEENYCPLIIYSPNIKEKTIVDEVAYQMDIYPTILHVIGAEDYYWKGFGVNLLDSVARQNRPISPEDAFELSDKLIRANYFKEIEDSLYSQNH